MPIIIFDDAGDAQYAYGLLESVGGLALGAGPDDLPALGAGVDVAEADLLPDLVVDRLYFIRTELTEGEEVRLSMDLYNAGWRETGETEVHFYLGDPSEGGTQLGGAIPVATLAPGASVANLMSDIFALPVGTNEYYAVAVAVPDEVATENNTASASLESLPPDLTGPQVVLELPGTGVLREGVSTLTLSFDEPVNWLGEPNISLVEQTEGVMPPDHVYLAADGQSATLIFEGGLPVAAAADTYTLRVLDSVVDAAGNTLDGDIDGSPGGDYAVAFTVALNGDATYDGKVNIFDLLKVRQNYLKPPGPDRDDNADVTGDDQVNIFDLLMVRQNYLRELEPVGGGAAGGGSQALALMAEQEEGADDRSAEDGGAVTDTWLLAPETVYALEADSAASTSVGLSEPASPIKTSSPTVDIKAEMGEPIANIKVGNGDQSAPDAFTSLSAGQGSTTGSRESAPLDDDLVDVLALPALEVLGVA